MKKTMNKKLWLAAALIIAATIAILYTPKEEASGKPVVKIGMTLPLSGNIAHMGAAIKKGIDFAIKDLNARPDGKFRYRAILEDNMGETRHVASMLKKLLLQDRVSLLMTFYSSNAKMANPLLIERKTVGIHHSYTAGELDGVYNFKNMPTSLQIAEMLAGFINERSHKRIAYVPMQTPASRETQDVLEKKVKGEIREFATLVGDRDFKTVVQKIREFNPDIIVVSLDTPELELFARELIFQNVGATVVSWDLVFRSNELGLFEGWYTVNTPLGGEEFQKRFGSQTTYYAPYFYDSVVIFANALETAAGEGDIIPSGADISKNIYAMKTYDGAAGHYDIQSSGEFFVPVALYKIENGKVVEVKNAKK